jgi:predicted ester cyclase
MGLEENKNLVLGYFEEVLSNRNLELLDKYFDQNLLFNGRPLKNIQFGGFLKSFYLTPFPDFHTTIENQFAKGDRVVTRVYLHGTHKGEFFGVFPTNNEIKILGITIDRIIDGKVKEMWHQADIWGLLQQLGVKIEKSSQI